RGGGRLGRAALGSPRVTNGARLCAMSPAMIVRCTSQASAHEGGRSTGSTAGPSVAASSSNAALVSPSALSQTGVRTKAKRGGSGGGSRCTARKSGAANGSVSGSAGSWAAVTSRVGAGAGRGRAEAPVLSSLRGSATTPARGARPRRRLGPDTPPKGAGPEDGSVSLAAERERHHAGGDRRRRSRRGAAGRARVVVRVASGPGMIIGEFGGHRLADDDRAGGAQLGDHGGVVPRPAAA